MEIQRLQMNLPQQTVQAPTVSTGDFAQVLQQAVDQSQSQSTSLDNIFARAAQETGVPLDLLKAVGKAESNFDPNARSHCGAMGVMQLMPATAKTLGVTDAYNPEQNIMAGAKHLRNMMDRFDGDATLALAAYNAGAGNVYKYDGIPPFPETQNYVRKVMAYAGQELTAGQAIWGGQTTSGAQTAFGGQVASLDTIDLLQTVQAQDQMDTEQMGLMLRTMMQWRLSEELNKAQEESNSGTDTQPLQPLQQTIQQTIQL